MVNFFPVPHAMQWRINASAILIHVAGLVDHASGVPSIMGSGATGHISLGIETFGVTGMLSASSKSSGLEEIEQVAFLGGMAHEYVLGAVVGVGGLAATRNFWDTVLVLEPWNVE